MCPAGRPLNRLPRLAANWDLPTLRYCYLSVCARTSGTSEPFPNSRYCSGKEDERGPGLIPARR